MHALKMQSPGSNQKRVIRKVIPKFSGSVKTLIRPTDLSGLSEVIRRRIFVVFLMMVSFLMLIERYRYSLAQRKYLSRRAR
jgi:hypothetical protein